MTSLKRIPINRPTGAELVAQIAEETAELPPTKREPEPPKQAAPSPAPITTTATEQVNFRASPEMARLLARLAVEQGSIRLVIAKLLREAGHEVPDADFAPPPGRRRLGLG